MKEITMRKDLEIEELKSLQITPRDLNEAPKKKEPVLRRPTRPLKKHKEQADKFLEVRKAIEDLSNQAAAIRAIIAEKERVAGGLAGELMNYAEEYKDRMIQTDRILIQLEDIPPHKAQVPAWRKVVDHLLDKLQGVSDEMRAEAEAFIEDSKREIPGETELLYKELESRGRTSVMGEGWVVWRKILDMVKGLAAKSKAKIAEIKDEVQDLMAGMSTAPSYESEE